MGENLDSYSLINSFYDLPFNIIFEIVKESNSMPETYKNVLSRCSIAYKDEAPKLLLVLPAQKIPLSVAIEIISSLTCSPFCMQFKEMYHEDQATVLPDYSQISTDISQINKNLMQLNQKMKNTNLICSYTIYGSGRITGKSYQCLTCMEKYNLPKSHTICPACAKLCHEGHVIVPSSYTLYYCDCGAHDIPNPCKLVPYPDKPDED